MGLSASQVRYLALTARQSDLEYQAQIINTRRIDLANKSSDVMRAYTDGMNNKVIRVATPGETTNGITTKIWNILNFSNLLEQGYQLMGANGQALVPSPYKNYSKDTKFTYAEYMALPESERNKCTSDCNQTYKLESVITAFNAGDVLTEEQFKFITPTPKTGFKEDIDADGNKIYTATQDIKIYPTDSLNYGFYSLLSKENQKECKCNNDGTYTAQSCLNIPDPEYKGLDIQSLLVSGQAQVVTNAFFQFMVEHGYLTGTLLDDNLEETTYEKLVDQYETSPATLKSKTIVDWQADPTNMFKQDFYTEDDPQVSANYEAATAEIQAQDKKLELELKKIETEHKAIQTEMEAVQKVIQKNIETTYKTFG